MTNLERALARLLQAIAMAQEAGDEVGLAQLMRRRDRIRAALAAPEQAWPLPPPRATSAKQRPCATRERALLQPLAE
jgi:hypothetical protein